jgi:tRNA1Val (adenine37-N6)-methyltransferase
MNVSDPDATLDCFYRGGLTLHQPKHGYRFSIDAVLLAVLARPRTGDLVIDLGTGCGVVALLMARRDETLTIYGVELQAELAQLARQNVVSNQLQGRVHILEHDIKTLEAKRFPRPADLIVANPPYYRLASGRLNPNDQRAIARHELRLTLVQLLGATRSLLRTGGRLVCIYACERLADLLLGMRQMGIEPKQLRLVHGKATDDARLCLVEGVQQGRPGMKVGPPLVIYTDDGAYTDTLQRYFDLGC